MLVSPTALSSPPLPTWFRIIGAVSPITWHVDVLRYLTVGLGHPSTIAIEAGAFVFFTLAGFAVAIRSLEEA